MVDSSNKKKRKELISEGDMATLLQRYDTVTILKLLQEMAYYAKPKMDWIELVKKTNTGITNAREYQLLWRHLAYRHSLLPVEHDARLQEDDSDMDCELEASPAASVDSAVEAIAHVKVIAASYVPSESDIPEDSTVEAPLTINIPYGMHRGPHEPSDSYWSSRGMNITFPVLLQKAAEGHNGNGLASSLASRKRRKKWLAEDDDELIAAVKRHGEGSWALIAKEEFDGERTASQLSQRWGAIRRRCDTSNSSTQSGLQRTEAQMAANRALSLAVGNRPPSKKLAVGLPGSITGPQANGSNSGSSSVQGSQQSQPVVQALPRGATSAPAAKPRVTGKKTMANSRAELMVTANSAAAAACMSGLTTAALVPKVEPGKNAVATLVPKDEPVKNVQASSLPRSSSLESALKAEPVKRVAAAATATAASSTAAATTAFTAAAVTKVAEPVKRVAATTASSTATVTTASTAAAATATKAAEPVKRAGAGAATAASSTATATTASTTSAATATKAAEPVKRAGAGAAAATAASSIATATTASTTATKAAEPVKRAGAGATTAASSTATATTASTTATKAAEPVKRAGAGAATAASNTATATTASTAAAAATATATKAVEPLIIRSAANGIPNHVRLSQPSSNKPPAMAPVFKGSTIQNKPAPSSFASSRLAPIQRVPATTPAQLKPSVTAAATPVGVQKEQTQGQKPSATVAATVSCKPVGVQKEQTQGQKLSATVAATMSCKPVGVQKEQTQGHRASPLVKTTVQPNKTLSATSAGKVVAAKVDTPPSLMPKNNQVLQTEVGRCTALDKAPAKESSTTASRPTGAESESKPKDEASKAKTNDVATSIGTVQKGL